MKIVKFKNGKYGVRKGWFTFKYLSIYKANNYCEVEWTSSVPLHHFYRGELAEVVAALEWLDDYGDDLSVTITTE